MTEANWQDKNSFLYPRSRYYGKFQPENLVFNANLQEFTQRISYITCLETAGKLSQEEAYQQIRALWKQLKHSKKQLAVGGKEIFSKSQSFPQERSPILT